MEALSVAGEYSQHQAHVHPPTSDQDYLFNYIVEDPHLPVDLSAKF